MIVADINQAAAEQVAKSIEDEGGTAAFVEQDVGDPQSVKQSVEFALERFGSLELAVNNAGIGGAQAPIAEHGLDDWNKVIAVNLSGVFYSLKHEIPAILRSGGGAIVNVPSILGSVGAANSWPIRMRNRRGRPDQEGSARYG